MFQRQILKAFTARIAADRIVYDPGRRQRQETDSGIQGPDNSVMERPPILHNIGKRIVLIGFRSQLPYEGKGGSVFPPADGGETRENNADEAFNSSMNFQFP